MFSSSFLCVKAVPIHSPLLTNAYNSIKLLPVFSMSFYSVVLYACIFFTNKSIKLEAYKCQKQT